MTKSYVGSFGYHFSLVDFVIKSMPVLCIGTAIVITLWEVLW